MKTFIAAFVFGILPVMFVIMWWAAAVHYWWVLPLLAVVWLIWVLWMARKYNWLR